MEEFQVLIRQWWTSSDDTAHMAVIAFGSLLLITMVFSIIGTYTNPARRPHNEIAFRKFSEARLAAKNEPLAAEDVQEPIDQDKEDTPGTQAMREVRAMRPRNL